MLKLRRLSIPIALCLSALALGGCEKEPEEQEGAAKWDCPYQGNYEGTWQADGIGVGTLTADISPSGRFAVSLKSDDPGPERILDAGMADDGSFSGHLYAEGSEDAHEVSGKLESSSDGLRFSFTVKQGEADRTGALNLIPKR